MGKHTEWRKLAKKARRKRIRRISAQKICAIKEKEQQQREASPGYQLWLEEQQSLEEHQRKEEETLRKIAHQCWIQNEHRAQQEWQLLQQKLKLIKEERARHHALIKAEWEKEQQRLKELEEEKRKEKELKLKEELLLKEQLENFIEKGGEMPSYLRKILETNPNKPVCPFFKKVGACRFGDACSRNHQRPCVSKILLILNFYSHISLEQSTENEYGCDSLEFESHERYNHFKEFFYDILPELEKFGQIKQFKVCCNEEPHLRGNVYVEYSDTRQAVKAYRVFQARWYGGKQLNVEFCGIESWKNAICGLFFKKACPKGSACNFLHVFRNPENLYNQIEKAVQPVTYVDFDEENDPTGRNWRWSESPEKSVKSHIEDKMLARYKSRENNQKCRSRSHKSRSRSKQRHRSRSPHSRSKHIASRKLHKKSKR